MHKFKRVPLQLLTIILVLIFSNFSFSFAETITEIKYYRSDQHSINGLDAYQLKSTNSDSSDRFYNYGVANVWLPDAIPDSNYYASVYVRHLDGTEAMLATGIALTNRCGLSEGYQSNTWNCPEIDLVSTDAIKIVSRIDTRGALSAERTFVTEQLGAAKLNGATWTFTRYTGSSIAGGNPHYQWSFISFIAHGNSNHATRIEGFSYEVYVDIGLRIYDGTALRTIACDTDFASHKLRIAKEGKTYGIVLVPPIDSRASKIYIYDGTSIKALRLF